MIDLHAHLLPGIDDGPDTLEEAVAMCRAAADDGCTALVATPHQRHGTWWNGDQAALEALRRELASAVGAEPAIHLGAEVRIGGDLVEALEPGAGHGVTSLAGSRYLLLEFGRWQVEPAPEALVHELVVAGWRPVLAHPEEIEWLSLGMIGQLVARGAALQLTGNSILGSYGRRIQERARSLLDDGLAHFVASDTHDLEQRPPGLAAAARELTRRWGRSVAELLTVTNPRAVLEDRPLPSPAEVLATSSTGS